jgi:hypothetical protein
MVIRSDKMGQSWLLPPDISELIPVDYICYLVIAIVNGIDVSEVEEKYRFKPGNPAYQIGEQRADRDYLQENRHLR